MRRLSNVRQPNSPRIIARCVRRPVPSSRLPAALCTVSTPAACFTPTLASSPPYDMLGHRKTSMSFLAVAWVSAPCRAPHHHNDGKQRLPLASRASCHLVQVLMDSMTTPRYRYCLVSAIGWPCSVHFSSVGLRLPMAITAHLL